MKKKITKKKTKLFRRFLNIIIRFFKWIKMGTNLFFTYTTKTQKKWLRDYLLNYFDSDIVSRLVSLLFQIDSLELPLLFSFI